MVPPSKKKWERFLDFLVMFPFFCKKKKKVQQKNNKQFYFLKIMTSSNSKSAFLPF